MIIIDLDQNKIKCTKTTRPNDMTKNPYNWDSLDSHIGNIKTKFMFSMRSNRSYLYFLYEGQWYKTCITTDKGQDIFEYIYNGDKFRELK